MAVEKLPRVGAPGKISERTPADAPTRSAGAGRHGEQQQDRNSLIQKRFWLRRGSEAWPYRA